MFFTIIPCNTGIWFLFSVLSKSYFLNVYVLSIQCILNIIFASLEFSYFNVIIDICVQVLHTRYNFTRLHIRDALTGTFGIGYTQLYSAQASQNNVETKSAFYERRATSLATSGSQSQCHCIHKWITTRPFLRQKSIIQAIICTRFSDFRRVGLSLAWKTFKFAIQHLEKL